MKLLIYSDDPGYGGTAVNNQALALGLRARGYEVAVATERPPAAGPIVAAREAAGVDSLWLDWDTNIGAKASHSLNEPAALFRAAAPDLILFSDGSLVSSLAAKRAATGLGIPAVTIVNLADPAVLAAHPDLVTAARTTLAASARVVAVSAENRDVLVRELGLDPGRIEVIHYGRPDAFFQPRDAVTRARIRAELAIGADELMCLTTARLEARKGYHHQVAAIQHLGPAAARLRFVWIGHEVGAYADSLRNALDGIEPRPRVQILAPRADVADLLDAADLFLLPSEAEGMPLCVMEAMAKGLPVIASAVSGVPEQLGDTGVLLPPPRTNPDATVAALADVLAKLSSDPALRQSLGEAARARASAMFRLDRMVDRYADLLTAVAAAPRPVAAGLPAYPNLLEPGRRVDFSRPEGCAEYLKRGWANPESWGTWTVGPEARLCARLPDGPRPPFLALSLEAAGFASGGRAGIRTDIAVNGRSAAAGWVFRGGIPQVRTVLTAAPPPDAPELDIRISIHDAVSPRAAGLSDDPRDLGLAVGGLRVSDPAGLTHEEALGLTLPPVAGVPAEVVRVALCRIAGWCPHPDVLSAGGPALRQRILGWWAIQGRRRHPDLWPVPAEALRDALAADTGAWAGHWFPLTWLMVSLYEQRPDIRVRMGLRTPAEADAFIAWFATEGVPQHDLADLLPEAHWAALRARLHRAGGTET